MDLNKIIQGCKDGDANCQSLLVRQYAPVLLSICRRYTRDQESANDALQETFINIFRYVGGYKGNGSFEGWMKRIAVNCSITFQKKHYKLYYQADTLSDSADHAEVPDVYSKMGREEILSLLDRLPPALYLVFNMHVVEGYSHKEISQELEISEGTSRASLSRARVRLIEIMNELEEKENQSIRKLHLI